MNSDFMELKQNPSIYFIFLLILGK